MNQFFVDWHSERSEKPALSLTQISVILSEVRPQPNEVEGPRVPTHHCRLQLEFSQRPRLVWSSTLLRSAQPAS